jgi:ribosomal protein S18 acetylase RimI-like enzyme
MASFIVGLRLSFKYIKTHRRLSQETYQPMQTLTIRKAGLIDIPLIRELTFKVWPQTYNGILSKEQIDYMLELMYSEKSLQEQMQTNEFILVYRANQAVGFASVGIVSPKVYKLHKIYVLPAEQGKGTGKFIIDYLVNAMKHRGVEALELNVNRHNPAKGFYEQLGFNVKREEDIDIGHGFFMNDYLMEKKIGTAAI